MSTLTPQQIIDNARTRIEAAVCPVSLHVVWDQALGSLHALYELGLISKSSWRGLHREFDALGECCLNEIEAQQDQGGAQ